jgi:hypothetical protein
MRPDSKEAFDLHRDIHQVIEGTPVKLRIEYYQNLLYIPEDKNNPIAVANLEQVYYAVEVLEQRRESILNDMSGDDWPPF